MCSSWVPGSATPGLLQCGSIGKYQRRPWEPAESLLGSATAAVCTNFLMCHGQARAQGRAQLIAGKTSCFLTCSGVRNLPVACPPVLPVAPLKGKAPGVFGTKWHKTGHNMLFVTVLVLIVNQSALYFKACGHGRELPAKQTT